MLERQDGSLVPDSGVYLRISVTDQCQLRCSYCRPGGGAGRPIARSERLRFEEIVSFVRAVACTQGISKLRLTGGEPLLRPGIVELIEMLAREGIPDLGMTTNGQLLARFAPRLARAGLSRVNVSLDTLDPASFRRITGGGVLDRTLSGIEAARVHGLTPIKINAVVMRGVNDHELADLAGWGIAQGVEVRFLELMPLGHARAGARELFVSSAEILSRLERALVVEQVAGRRPGQTCQELCVTDASGRRGIIGLISPQSHPFCGDCRRLRLTSAGELISCLASGQAVPIRPLLTPLSMDPQGPLARQLAQALESKTRFYPLAAQRLMVQVGG